MKHLVCSFVLAFLATPALRAGVPAASLPPAGLPTAVAAILRQRCTKCHGEKSPKARLDLTTPAGVARGSRKGAVVRSRDPDSSLLEARRD